MTLVTSAVFVANTSAHGSREPEHGGVVKQLNDKVDELVRQVPETVDVEGTPLEFVCSLRHASRTPCMLHIKTSRRGLGLRGAGGTTPVRTFGSLRTQWGRAVRRTGA